VLNSVKSKKDHWRGPITPNDTIAIIFIEDEGRYYRCEDEKLLYWEFDEQGDYSAIDPKTKKYKSMNWAKELMKTKCKSSELLDDEEWEKITK
jgi:hypothetical protein